MQVAIKQRVLFAGGIEGLLGEQSSVGTDLAGRIHGHAGRLRQGLRGRRLTLTAMPPAWNKMRDFLKWIFLWVISSLQFILMLLRFSINICLGITFIYVLKFV